MTEHPAPDWDILYKQLNTGSPQQSQGLTVHTFVEAQVSSRRAAARQGLDTVLEQVHPGDLILVSELSRLGRSVGWIIQLVDRLMKQRVQLVAIKENIQLKGTQDIQTKVMVTMFGLFA
jgi:DNA invertase Pin-like site-specific DNA recombinase